MGLGELGGPSAPIAGPDDRVAYPAVKGAGASLSGAAEPHGRHARPGILRASSRAGVVGLALARPVMAPQRSVLLYNIGITARPCGIAEVGDAGLEGREGARWRPG